MRYRLNLLHFCRKFIIIQFYGYLKMSFTMVARDITIVFYLHLNRIRNSMFKWKKILYFPSAFQQTLNL